MPDKSTNKLERMRDAAAASIGRRQEATDKAFGVGERPFGSRKLSPGEKAKYFGSLDPMKQQELWDQMESAEQEEIRQNWGR